MAHRILVVDDDKWVVQAIRSYLEQAHFEVITAYNGKDAIAQFERNRPDLVILDWMLPEIDGLSVAERIRRRSDVPIIMLTARTDEVDRLTRSSRSEGSASTRRSASSGWKGNRSSFRRWGSTSSRS